MSETNGAEPGYDRSVGGLYFPVEIKSVASGDASTFIDPKAWLAEWAGPATSSGMTVNTETAMGLSSYFAGLRNISTDVGKVPLMVYERLERGKRRAPEHDYYSLLHDFPNREMESLTFRETVTAHALSWGNGYAEIERNPDTQRAVALHVVHPSRVTVRRDERTLAIVYDVVVRGLGPEDLYGYGVYRIRAENMFHLRGLGAEGLVGYSVVSLARESLGLGLAAQRFGSSFFGNGAHVGGVLQHPLTISEGTLTKLRSQFGMRGSAIGADKAGSMLILEEGMTYARTGIPPEDAQFLDTRSFEVTEMARWLGLKPHKLGDLRYAHYNNIEHQEQEYVQDALMPWFVRWEQQCQRKLFFDEPNYFCEHLLQSLLRGDSRSRSAFYTAMFNIGIFTINEIRDLERMNPIESIGAESHFIAANNLQPLEQVFERAAAQKQEHQDEDVERDLEAEVLEEEVEDVVD